MKFKLTVLAMTLAASAAASAAEINYAYRIDGARSLVPLQAFDNGRNLYLQYTGTRLSAPPVPFAEDGTPLRYEIEPPYMVLPAVKRVVLRVGATKATIEAAEDQQGVRSSGGVLGTNVWYGKASPAQVTAMATRPVSMAQVQTERTVAAAKALAQAEADAEAAANRIAAERAKQVKEEADAARLKREKELVAATEKPNSAALEKPVVIVSPPNAGVVESPKHLNAELTSVQVQEAPVSSGRFVAFPVAKKEKSWLLFSISRPVVATEVEELMRYASPVIESDGTAQGYEKAAALKSMMGGKAVVIRSKGADLGYIRVGDEG